ncbi:MAG: hypothetical protein WCO33_01730 [bacterium]
MGVDSSEAVFRSFVESFQIEHVDKLMAGKLEEQRKAGMLYVASIHLLSPFPNESYLGLTRVTGNECVLFASSDQVIPDTDGKRFLSLQYNPEGSTFKEIFSRNLIKSINKLLLSGMGLRSPNSASRIYPDLAIPLEELGKKIVRKTENKLMTVQEYREYSRRTPPTVK